MRAWAPPRRRPEDSVQRRALPGGVRNIMQIICVYVLKSQKDQHLYIGSTTNLYRRFNEHNSGNVRATKSRRPLKLFCYQQCENIKEAAELEKLYKRSHDVFERALRNGKFIIFGV